MKTVLDLEMLETIFNVFVANKPKFQETLEAIFLNEGELAALEKHVAEDDFEGFKANVPATLIAFLLKSNIPIVVEVEDEAETPKEPMVTKRELELMEQRKEQIQKDLDAAHRQIDALSADISTLDNKNNQLSQQMGRLKTESKQKQAQQEADDIRQSEEMKQIKQENARLVSETRMLQSALKEEQKNYLTLKKELDTLQVSLESATQKSSAPNSLRAQPTISNNEQRLATENGQLIGRLQEFAQRLQAEVKRCEALEENLAFTNRQHNALQSELDELREENAAQKQLLSQIDRNEGPRLRAEIDQLTHAGAAKDQALQTQSNTLEQAAARVRTLEAELAAQPKAPAHDDIAAIARLQGLVTSHKAEAAKLADILTRTQLEHKHALAETERILAREVQQLATAASRANQQVSYLNADLQKTLAALQASSAEVLGLTAEVKRLRDEAELSKAKPVQTSGPTPQDLLVPTHLFMHFHENKEQRGGLTALADKIFLEVVSNDTPLRVTLALIDLRAPDNGLRAAILCPTYGQQFVQRTAPGQAMEAYTFMGTGTQYYAYRRELETQVLAWFNIEHTDASWQQLVELGAFALGHEKKQALEQADIEFVLKEFGPEDRQFRQQQQDLANAEQERQAKALAQTQAAENARLAQAAAERARQEQEAAARAPSPEPTGSIYSLVWNAFTARGNED